MPFAPLLRTTLLLSSLTVAASYTLYETNPTFRAFVDRTLDQISQVWSDVLAALSPEERQRQRERQRHVFLGELSTRGVAGARDAAAAVVPEAQASGQDVRTQDARARRRRMWERAEENSRQIRERAARRNARDSAADVGSAGIMADEGAETSARVGNNTLHAAYTDASPSSAPALSADTTAHTALHSHPSNPDATRRPVVSPGSETPEVLTPPSDVGIDFDDAVSQISASTERYSHIMTPTSPSLRSVSEADTDLLDIDPMEYTHTDLGVEHVADPPVSLLDDLEDPDIEDIDAYVRGSLTPSTISLSDADEVMSVRSEAESDFTGTGWATENEPDAESRQAGSSEGLGGEETRGRL